MDKLYIEAQGNKCPQITFEPSSGHFELLGISRSENARAFYEPVINWLDLYAENPVANTTIDVKLQYFNTSSAKSLLEIFEKLITLHEEGKTTLIIKWYYQEDDEDMLDAGENYGTILDFPFETIVLK